MAGTQETRESWSYAGFVSYSHTGDAVFASQLQRGVERFAKPWNRMRALRLFRDESNLTASPGLWTSIETALTGSEWFVLVISPEAAASVWVGREISHWLQTRGGTDHVLLVVTAGEMVWDEASRAFDPVRSTALPPALATAFPEEPLWLDARWARTTDVYDDEDPRLQRTVVDVAAAIRGLSKDEMVGAAAREHRRTNRIKRAAQGSLATLLVLSIVATVVALGQRHTAEQQRHVAEQQRAAAQTQARLAEARELAALSQPLLSTNLAAASTLAVAGYQRDPDPATRGALFRAAVASPHLVGSYDVGGDVTALPLASSSGVVALGLRTGAVLAWRPGGTTPVLTLPGPVTTVAQSPDASVVAASDGSHALIATGGTTIPVTLPAGMSVHTLAVTPDGSHVWVRGNVSGRSTYVGFDLVHHTATVRTDDLPIRDSTEDLMVAPTDDQLVVLDPAHGFWARISANDGRIESHGRGEFGMQEQTDAMSSNGRYLAAVDALSRSIQVWPVTRPTSPFDTPAEASSATAFDLAAAVSPSGRAVAVADDGAVYVSQTTLDSTANGLAGLARITLDGATGAQAQGLRFLDETHLVSVVGDELTEWDLGQADRLGATRTLPIDTGCHACPSPAVALGDDGRALSVNSAGVAALTAADGTTTGLPGADSAYAYSFPLWDAAEHLFVLPVSPGFDATPGQAVPRMDGVRIWPLGKGDGIPALASALSGADQVVSVLQDGEVVRQRADDGAVVSSFTTGVASTVAAAVSPDGGLVALVAAGRVHVFDVSTHAELPATGGAGVDAVALTDRDLLSTTAAGGLSIWSATDGTLLRTLTSDPSYTGLLTLSPDGTVVARPRTDLGVDLTDTATGQVIGRLGVPGLAGEARVGTGFAPDGTSVATLLEGDVVGMLLDVRDLSSAHLTAVVCATSVRHLTAQVWQTFAGEAPYSPPEC